MKKMISLLLVMLGLFFCLCGCRQIDTNDNLAPVESTTESIKSTSSTEKDPTPTQTVVASDQIPESLSEKLIREIDDAYKEEQKKPENSTTVGMVTLSNTYAEKWKQVADEYYNKIMAYDGIHHLNENYYSSDDLHAFVSNMKSNWEHYNQTQCENYVKTLKAIYGAGTIVGPIMADYEYNMQMEWALQLVGICQQLRIT